MELERGKRKKRRLQRKRLDKEETLSGVSGRV